MQSKVHDFNSGFSHKKYWFLFLQSWYMKVNIIYAYFPFKIGVYENKYWNKI